MPRPTATTPKPLSPAERKAHVEALVAEGKLTRRQAALIDYREPTDEIRRAAREMVPVARRALARGRRRAA